MRKYGRTDANQKEIVDGLRQIGASVQSLSAVGDGCPDILVGFAGQNWLFEIKDENKPPSARRLTPEQVIWHRAWWGRVQVITSLREALAALGVYSLPSSSPK